MIFIPLLIYAFIAFSRGNVVNSLLVFFFFLTNGFQLIPQELFDTGLVINKALDFAIIYIVVINVYLLFTNKYLYKSNTIVIRWLYAFALFYCVVIYVNIYIYNVPVSSVIKNSRYYLLLPVIFIFKYLYPDEIDRLKLILFRISIILSFIFILQVIFSVQILTGHVGGTMDLAGMKIIRFYNIPILTYYFLFYSIFSNPFEGKWKYISQTIIILSFILPMHRGFLASFFVLLLYGIYVTQKTPGRFLKTSLVISVLLLPLSGLIIDRFSTKVNTNDITELFVQGISGYDREMSETQTMYFRFAHTLERLVYVYEDPDKTYALCGLGLWTDDDEAGLQKFDFVTGYVFKEDYENLHIFFTNDIAWSVFITQIGLVGMFFYLGFYCSFTWFFFKRRKNITALINLLVLLLFIFTSISSVEILTVMGFVMCMMDYVKLSEEKNKTLSNDDFQSTNLYVTQA